MDLLPKSHTEFTSAEYWESFFKKRGSKAFEWYGEYNNLCGVLHKYVKPADKVLMVGCGNSRLSEDMYDVGYHNISNIDISDVVIRQMTERNAKKREQMNFEKMDVTQMSYNDGAFSAAVDKGTLDALAADAEEGTVATVKAMFTQVSRVLRLGGRYIIISLLQDQVLSVLLQHFGQCSWPLRIHRIDSQATKDEKDAESSFSLPVFAVIITKFKDIPGMKQVVEVCNGDQSPQRLDSIQQLASTVKEMQYYGVVRQQLATKQVQDQQLQIDLFSDLGSAARYTMWVVDSQRKCSNKFAIFIVPQGRETEWMFSTDAGRRMLSDSAGFDRLVVVALSREHRYDNMDAIKAELSTKVMELAPPSYKKGAQVPFLSIGDDIGHRTVRHRGRSEMSGDYIIEDAEGDEGQSLRRLIFLANQNIVQSEARLVPVATEKKKKKKGGKKGGEKLAIDKSYLACGHHHSMVAGLAFLPEEVNDPRVLLVGLGGGPLAVFLTQHFPQVSLDVVEIDAEMTKVAQDWFGFHGSDRVKVHIADGLDFIAELAKKGDAYDAVMFDVDSKDTSIGLSCPPPAFLQQEFLVTLSSTLTEGGVFVLNFVCRDQSLQSEVIGRISGVFPCVMSVDVPQEVNRIVFASRCEKLCTEACKDSQKSPNETPAPPALTQAAKRLDKQLRASSSSTEVELAESVAQLRILSIK